MNTESHITFDGVGFTVSTTDDSSSIWFEVGENFKKAVTDPLKLIDGRTIGQANQDYLHEKLDAWIKENLTPKEEK